MSENFQFANSFDLHGLLLSDAVAVSLPGTIFWIWTKNSSRNIQNKKLKAILFMIITNSIHKTNCEKWCSWPILQFFSSLRCLLITSKAQQASHFFQNWRTLWEVTKTPAWVGGVGKNGRNTKIAKLLHFFSDF